MQISLRGNDDGAQDHFPRPAPVAPVDQNKRSWLVNTPRQSFAASTGSMQSQDVGHSKSPFHDLAVRPLSGCITVPGAVSLAGLILSVATIWAAEQILASDAKLGLRTYPLTVASDVLSTLSLVYSIVLVVFILAAGNIAPRLLDRFLDDRTNQIAVGLLGALFLHSLL